MSFLTVSDFSILWLRVSFFNLYKESKFLSVNFEPDLKLSERKNNRKELHNWNYPKTFHFIQYVFKNLAFFCLIKYKINTERKKYLLCFTNSQSRGKTFLHETIQP